MRRRRCSTWASASSFSRSWRAIRRSTASPVTTGTRRAPVLVTSNACATPGRKTWNSATSLSPAISSDAGSATGTRRSSSRAARRGPAGGARGHEHRHVHPLAPLAAAAASATSGATRSAFESARMRGSARQPRVVLGQLGLDHPMVLDRVAAVERREVEHVHEQPRALDVREEVVAEARRRRRRPRSARGCRRSRAGGRRRRACRAPARAW